MENVAAGDAEAPLQIERRQRLALDHDRRGCWGSIPRSRRGRARRRARAARPSCAFAQRVGRVLQEDSHDVIARRARAIGSYMVGMVISISGDREGRPYLASSQARSTYSIDGQMCMVARCCGPGAPGSAVNSGRPLKRQVHLERSSFGAEARGCRSTKSAGRSRCVQQAEKRAAADRDCWRRSGAESLRRSPAPRRARGRLAPGSSSTGALVRISAPLRARGIGDGVRDRAHAAAHESPQAAMAVDAAHAVMQQDVGRAGRARAAVGADHAVGGERDLDLFATRTIRRENRRRSG